MAAPDDNQGRTYLGTYVYQASDAMELVSGTLTPTSGTQMFVNLRVKATDDAGNTSQVRSEPDFLGEQPDSIYADRFRN